MKTAICYARKSHSDQAIESQVEEIKRYCENNGYKPKWYLESHTGTTMDRPVFEQMNQDLFMGEAKTVIITEVSRIGRTMIEAMNVLGEWLSNDITLIATGQQFNFSGAIGKTIAALLLGLGELELESKKARQKRGIALAKKDPAKYAGRKEGSYSADVKKIIKYREEGRTIEEIAKLTDTSHMTVIRHIDRAMINHCEKALIEMGKQNDLIPSFELQYDFKNGATGKYGDEEIPQRMLKSLIKAAKQLSIKYASEEERYKLVMISLTRLWHEEMFSIGMGDDDLEDINSKEMIEKAERDAANPSTDKD